MVSEVYCLNECQLKRVGSAAGDTTETVIGAYAEGITVNVTREFGERFDTSGVRQKRIELKRQAQVDIKKLYASEDFLFDGNDIKFYLVASTGSEVKTLTKAHWQTKGYEVSDLVRENVTVIGNDFS